MVGSAAGDARFAGFLLAFDGALFDVVGRRSDVCVGSRRGQQERARQDEATHEDSDCAANRRRRREDRLVGETCIHATPCEWATFLVDGRTGFAFDDRVFRWVGIFGGIFGLSVAVIGCHKAPSHAPEGDDSCTGARCVEEAEAAMYYGDHETARAPLLAVCEGGDGFACFRLAELEQHGRGGPVNLAGALQLYEDACNKGHAEGCARRAEMAGEDADGLATAFEFSVKGCTGGLPQSCVIAARQVHTGSGVERDDTRATMLFQEACRLGDVDGCVGAGDLLVALPRATPEDKARSFAAYNLACKRRHSEACLKLALAYYEGIGTPASAQAAQTHFARACEFGQQDGCRAAQQIEAVGGKPVVLQMTTAIAETDMDGLAVRSLSCRTTERGQPVVEDVLASVAEHKLALDACAKNGAAIAVSWEFANGRVREAKVSDRMSQKQAKCVVAALRRAKPAATGDCTAVLLLGAPDGAQKALAARSVPKGNVIRVRHEDED